MRLCAKRIRAGHCFFATSDAHDASSSPPRRSGDGAAEGAQDLYILGHREAASHHGHDVDSVAVRKVSSRLQM